jgi:hypothetical protein
LRRWAASDRRSRSSGVRARRAIRWLSSECFPRKRAASAPPTVRPRSVWSSMTAGTGCTGGAVSRAGFSLRPCEPWERCRGPRSRGSTRGGGIGSRSKPSQSKVRSGCVCSSASRTSASIDLRPICTLGGDLNRYRTRARAAPCPAR